MLQYFRVRPDFLNPKSVYPLDEMKWKSLFWEENLKPFKACLEIHGGQLPRGQEGLAPSTTMPGRNASWNCSPDGILQAVVPWQGLWCDPFLQFLKGLVFFILMELSDLCGSQSCWWVWMGARSYHTLYIWTNFLRRGKPKVVALSARVKKVVVRILVSAWGCGRGWKWRMWFTLLTHSCGSHSNHKVLRCIFNPGYGRRDSTVSDEKEIYRYPGRVLPVFWKVTEHCILFFFFLMYLF